MTSTHDRARRRLLDRLQHRVGRLVLVAAQALGLEQDRAPCDRLRSARAPPRAGSRSRTSSFTRYDAPPGSNSTTSGCTPRCTSREPALVVADADQQRRELARRVLDARTARADEQVRVRRAARRGVAQRLDRALLTDDVREHRRPSLRKHGSTTAPDPGRDLVGRSRRRRRAPSRAPARARGTRPRTRAWNSAPARSNRSRSAGDARFGDVVGEVEHDHERRVRGRRSPIALSRSTSSTPSPRADALVRERRRREAVAHDDRAARERRAGSRSVDVLRRDRRASTASSVRGVERRVAVQQHCAQLGARLRVARLAASRRPRARSRAADSASRSTCVLLPTPSPPSRTMKRHGVASCARRVARALAPCASAGARRAPRQHRDQRRRATARAARPGSATCSRPDRAPRRRPRARRSRPSAPATNGPIVSDSSRHRRTIV